MANQRGSLYLPGYSDLSHTDIENFLNTTFSDADQSICAQLITGAELSLARECNRNFLVAKNNAKQVYYDVFDAGEDEYFPVNTPIYQVTKIELDGSSIYDSTDEAGSSYKKGTDFKYNKDSLKFYIPICSASWDRDALTVYYTLEEFWGEDVKNALMEWVSHLMGNRENGGREVKRMTFASYSIEYNPKDTPMSVQQVIETYKRIIV